MLAVHMNVHVHLFPCVLFVCVCVCVCVCLDVGCVCVYMWAFYVCGVRLCVGVVVFVEISKKKILYFQMCVNT